MRQSCAAERRENAANDVASRFARETSIRVASDAITSAGTSSALSVRSAARRLFTAGARLRARSRGCC